MARRKAAEAETREEEPSDAIDQRLFYLHKRTIRGLKEAVDAASAALRNAYKRAKSDLGDTAKADITDSLGWDKKGGEAAVQAEIARLRRLARWNGFSLGKQTDLFKDVDPQPTAAERGYLAGLNGDDCSPPYDAGSPEGQQWIERWHDGQAAILGLQRQKDADEFEADVDDDGESEADPPRTIGEEDDEAGRDGETEERAAVH